MIAWVIWVKLQRDSLYNKCCIGLIVLFCYSAIFGQQAAIADITTDTIQKWQYDFISAKFVICERQKAVYFCFFSRLAKN